MYFKKVICFRFLGQCFASTQLILHALISLVSLIFIVFWIPIQNHHTYDWQLISGLEGSSWLVPPLRDASLTRPPLFLFLSPITSRFRIPLSLPAGGFFHHAIDLFAPLLCQQDSTCCYCGACALSVKVRAKLITASYRTFYLFASFLLSLDSTVCLFFEAIRSRGHNFYALSHLKFIQTAFHTRFTLGSASFFYIPPRQPWSSFRFLIKSPLQHLFTCSRLDHTPFRYEDFFARRQTFILRSLTFLLVTFFVY